MNAAIELRERPAGGYMLYVDGRMVSAAFTLWGARWLAWKIRRRLTRGLHIEVR